MRPDSQNSFGAAFAAASRAASMRCREWAAHRGQRIRDAVCSTYVTTNSPAFVGRPIAVGQSVGDAAYPDVLELLMQHKVALLGLDWVRSTSNWRASRSEVLCGTLAARFTRQSLSRPGHPNALRQMEISGRLSPDYSRIDWWTDMRAGRSWSAIEWYLDVPVGMGGADIKVPWELGRLQHLPFLALHARTEPGGTDLRAVGQEFESQILDFCSANPPRVGPQWAGIMDVAIRAANLVLAADILIGRGVRFDVDFSTVLSGCVYEHARHIASNLEWSERHALHNHYFADVVGLLYACAHLEPTPETDSWLSLAVQEVLHQTVRQFGSDGGHIEGSTSYHRLCGEFAVYGAALVLGLVRSGELQSRWRGGWRPLRGPWVVRDAEEALAPLLGGAPPTSVEGFGQSQVAETLARIARFTLGATAPDGLVIQIGDNDSGRLFRLEPVFRRDKCSPSGLPVEQGRDHRHLLAAVAGLGIYGLSDSGAAGVDAEVARALSCGCIGAESPGWQRCSKTELDASGDLVFADSARACGSLSMPVSIDTSGTLEWRQWPVFGLFVAHAEGIWISVRCGERRAGMPNGHTHCDQLSVELWVDGCRVTGDPGTFVYTSDPVARNAYRSVAAHFAPHFGDAEPGGPLGDLFQMAVIRAGVSRIDPRSFLGWHEGFGFRVYREIRFERGVIVMTDYSCGDAIDTPWIPNIGYSPGYGEIPSNAHVCDAEECVPYL